MNIFLVEGVEHYISLINQQVKFPELREDESFKDLLEQKKSLASACCKTRREILENMSDNFVKTVEKLAEDKETMRKLSEAFNCTELIFSCRDSRNNLLKEVRYERQE